MMHTFTHMIFYVQDVERTLNFYKEAFDLDHRFIHESGQYGELDTGSTCLAFASVKLAGENLSKGFEKLDPQGLPIACEICLSSPDVQASFDRALKKGAVQVEPPKEKPWGQTVAYVRDPEGILIAITSK